MPPALPPSQGSRAGLITALVIFVILAVTMTVTTFHGYSNWTKAETSLKDLKDAHTPFLSDANIAGDPRVASLMKIKDAAASSETPDKEAAPYRGANSVIDVAITETELLSKVIGGGTSPDLTVNVGRTALADAAKKIEDAKNLLSFTLPKDNLVTALSAVTQQLVQVAAARQTLEEQLKVADKNLKEEIERRNGQLAEKDKAIEAAKAETMAAAEATKKVQDDALKKQADLEGTTTELIKNTQKANADLMSQNQTAVKKAAAAEQLTKKVQGKLKVVRVNPQEPIVQHPDGNVIRVGDDKTCFISLGSRQRVTKGLTFEVYDKNKGMPPLGAGLTDAGLPIGKASIEVYDVGPDTSQCRIIKTQPGQAIVIGDLISNLIYDPEISYNFVVFGDFDLSGTSVPGPNDANVIKRLVTQWGGKVQDHVDVSTDFVIMGVEPVVHTLTDPGDAARALRMEQEKKRLADWQAVVHAANDYGVPIMNQNRFLYFIGYYDQATR